MMEIKTYLELVYSNTDNEDLNIDTYDDYEKASKDMSLLNTVFNTIEGRCPFRLDLYAYIHKEPEIYICHKVLIKDLGRSNQHIY